MSSGKLAVLLMAYGSPNSLDEVGEYLTQIRGGREPTAAEIERLKERYRQVGGKTPLLEITRQQSRALENNLRSKGLDIPVYVGMKHWHPFVEDVVPQIVRDSVTSIIGIALAPHYSRLSINGYEDAARKGLGGSTIQFTMVKSWHKEKGLVSAISTHLLKTMTKMPDPSKTVVLFTAHSLPKKMVTHDDPYEKQLLETSKLVAETARVKSWDFAYQSAGEPKEDWLGPLVKEQLDKLDREGFRDVLAYPVGFVSDHLEILYDLDIEARNYASSLGIGFERASSLNDDPEFIDALASLVASAIQKEVLSII